MVMDTQWEMQELVDQQVCPVEEKVREIILHDDDFNTFEHVIVSLMEICDHDPEQAEQCAWIVHYTGKCGVKRGTYATLRPMCEALCGRGLSADIQ